jgi:hypothetical protein
VLYVEVVADAVVCSSVPPVDAVYHLNVPVGPPLVEVKASDPGPQRDAPVAAGAAGADPAFTVATTVVRVLVHPPLKNST